MSTWMVACIDTVMWNSVEIYVKFSCWHSQWLPSLWQALRGIVYALGVPHGPKPPQWRCQMHEMLWRGEEAWLLTSPKHGDFKACFYKNLFVLL